MPTLRWQSPYLSDSLLKQLLLSLFCPLLCFCVFSILIAFPVFSFNDIDYACEIG